MFCYPLHNKLKIRVVIEHALIPKKVKHDNFVNSFQLNHVSEEQRNRLI